MMEVNSRNIGGTKKKVERMKERFFSIIVIPSEFGCRISM